VKYARTVIGYHGCRRSVAKALLDGGPFKTSENDYDWLGRGIYFWEHGPDRALRWAKKYRHPAVVGAVIQLGKCFDLLDTRYTNDLGEFYPYLEQAHRKHNVPLPKNTGSTKDLLLRRLDCTVLNHYLAMVEAYNVTYDTVRGAFTEGARAFPGSKIRRETHVQIAVRNPECIVGVFVPR
jgi:hypothetical protein